MSKLFGSSVKRSSQKLKRAVFETLENRRLMSVEAPYGGVPSPVPGKIEAENYDTGGEGIAYHDLTAANQGGQYRLADGVDVETCSDTGGGYDIGHVQPTEWLKYTVKATTAGMVTIQSRVGSKPGGTIHYEVDGVAVGGEVTVPTTGDWQAYQTVSTSAFNLTAGQHVIRLSMDTQGVAGQDIGNFNYFQIVAQGTTPTVSTPFTSTPYAVPGQIEAENFDKGGEGIAYHDLTAANEGGQYRLTEGVDIQTTADTSGGYDLGHVQPTEWENYTINATAGSYTIQTRVASMNGGTFHYEVDGTPVGGEITMPNTGSWQAYQTVASTSFSLTAGKHVVRLVMDSASTAGDIGNFNSFAVVTATTTTVSTPFTGTPYAVPGQIEAENFDKGGEGVAYHDLTIANEGGQYRLTEGVDIQATADVSGVYDLGHVQPTEWEKYTINATAGSYTIQTRVASMNGGTFHYEVDGTPVGGEITMPNTGSWQAYQTVASTAFSLTAGKHVVRLVMDSAAGPGDIGNFNYFAFAASAPAGSTPFTGTPYAVPGPIEAENFDKGGEGIAYHDTTPTNDGGQYRLTEGVDIQATTDVSGAYDVSQTKPTEWMNYSINAAAGTYIIQAEVASADGGTFHYEVDGTPVGGEITMPNTGSWSTYQTVSSTSFPLTSGLHVVRLALDTTAVAGQDIGNINYFTFVNQSLPTVSVTATTPTADEVKLTPGVFTVSRTGSTTTAMTVTYTISGIAVSGTDYTPLTGSVIIPAGAASALVTVKPINDKKNDGPETVTLTITSAATYTPGASATATVTIGDGVIPTNSVISLTLINADTGQPIAGYDPIPAGATIDLSKTGASNFSIRANTNPGTVGSVVFGADGLSNIHTDNNPPYALLGNTGTVYAAWNPGSGSHTVTATAYTGNNASGTAGTPLSVTFTFTNSGMTSGWTNIAPSPIPRDEGQAAVDNGKLYAFGGFISPSYNSTVQADVYDPVANTWSSIANLPETMTHGSTVVVGSKIWIIGSFTNNENGPSSPHVWIYDTVANTYTAGPALPANAGGAGGVALLGSKIYYFSGLTRNVTNAFVNTNESIVLDLTNQAAGWTQLSSFPTPRNHMGSAVVNGVIYAIGGQNIKDETAGESAEVDKYNPATDTWTQVASMPIPLGHIATSVVVYNNTILVVDGESLNKAQQSSVYQYDPVANTWTLQSQWATPATRKSPISVLIGKELISVAGGSPDPVVGTGWERLLP